MPRPLTSAILQEASYGTPRVEWHALGGEAAASRLGTKSTVGLREVEAGERLASGGPNLVKVEKPESPWAIFLEEVREPLILLLLAIGVLYSIWGEIRDAVTIIVIIVVLVAAEVYNEYRAKSAITGLRKLAEPTTRVLREGREEEVAVEAIVPGDLLVLAPGRRVAGDARLVEAFGLGVDESALTGESAPIDKDPTAVLPKGAALADRVNMVYTGSLVVRGRGRAVVVATGTRTELGRIAGASREAKQPRTPLQTAIRELTAWMVWPALAVSVLVPVLGIFLSHQPLRRMILTGLSMAFAVMPEELPIIVTMILAVGGYRLAKRGAIAKRMRAVETLGSVTVIVTDKTGTLTEGRMALTKLEPLSVSRRLLELGSLTTTLETSATATGADPFDLAIFEAAGRLGIDAGQLHHANPLVAEFPFDPARRRMSVVRETDTGFLVIAKGAPESVLACSIRWSRDGKAEDLDVDRRRAILSIADSLAGSGMRLIALAEKTVFSRPAEQNQAESSLTLVGLAGFADPARPEVVGAIKTCRQAGIRVLMVTGDHAATAAAIASQVGIPTASVLMGADLDRLSDPELARALSTSPVLARCTPDQKQRVVRSLVTSGEVVAVTGDGVNDAPALSSAHVGVAMGKRGTDVAREAADIVLADDNFATIERATEEGRVVHSNLRKGVRFYLAFKLALTTATVLPVLLLLPVPFAPIQIILTELFMDLAASVSFAAEPAEPGLMGRPPRDPRARFMDRAMLAGLGSAALGLSAAVSAVYLVSWYGGASLATSQTMAFITLLLGTALLAMNMRSDRVPLFKLGLTTNLPLLVWAIVVTAFVLVAVLVPAARDLFKTAPLTIPQWGLVIGAAALGTLWMEAWKLLHFRLNNSSSREPQLTNA